MFSLPIEHEKSCLLLASVEIASHPSAKRKMEKIFLQILNRYHPRVAPAPTPWIVFAINEMFFVGTLELIEVELALKYDIGLGSGGLPLDVYRRPIALVVDVTALEADDELSDSSSVEIVSVCDEVIIDLTLSTDEEVTCRQKRKRKRVNKTRKRQRLEDTGSTDDEPEFWIDLMDMDDNENFNSGVLQPYDLKCSSPIPEHWSPLENAFSITNLRVGIFCPRPFRSRLMNAIMNAMDNMQDCEPHPQYKRNGFSLDTLWFLAANEYSALWMISTVEQISKKKYWRRACLIVEPWSSKFVVKNVLQLTLPWKQYRGNKKAKVIERLRKANLMHGSNRWNLIGCKLGNLKIQVTLAVNEETMDSLKRTQFYIFYGFSQYRCQVVKTALK
ncbi:uncharacterized protein LOC135710434 [Ochlerotatus camptorhynchus]|uniref:uncharacterized protein LOC135710434 n=1 Tax=Ochlerotatus camptorhynchus TaxID=644619 RepID=UPI0031D32CFE